MRTLMFSALLAATALLSPAVQAEGIEAGKQYVELSTPVPVAKPGKQVKASAKSPEVAAEAGAPEVKAD